MLTHYFVTQSQQCLSAKLILQDSVSEILPNIQISGKKSIFLL